ncbi:hypothetical protein BOX24_09170 [Leptospirillum ferriphilum]|uniref:Uncharacterized protein n=2 Tax=Leptospirillum ferriphilum TaxID=178606 RepID=A0A1V3STU5_9BACT|nr:hypothetical protein LFML04_1322 [Leptospirillum ferriphilum ML-04]OOH71204.1 hypothetical protein BOX24_09170 [Leptospirillum ferriphilum]
MVKPPVHRVEENPDSGKGKKDSVRLSLSSSRRYEHRLNGIVFSMSGTIMKPIGGEINSGHFLPFSTFFDKKLSLLVIDPLWRHP